MIILFCCKTDQPITSEHLRSFLSTDIKTELQAILEYYAKRWSIEIYFRQTKETLGAVQKVKIH